MNRISVIGSFALLCVAAVLLWSSADLDRETLWEQLPLSFGVVAFAWLGGPWRFRRAPDPIPVVPTTIACVLYVTGLSVDLIGLSVMAWTGMVWIWTNAFLEAGNLGLRKRLLPMLIFAFPWITHDLPLLSEAFQWSGAVVAEAVCRLSGLQTLRTGNNLIVEGMNISVGPGCSGMKTLEIMFLCGSLLAAIMLLNCKTFWLYLPWMFVLAWFTNCLRIVFLVATAAVTQSYQTVSWLHDSEGYVSLALMFPVTLLAFRVLQAFGNCGVGASADTGRAESVEREWASA